MGIGLTILSCSKAQANDSPSDVVRHWHIAGEKGDLEAMEKLVTDKRMRDYVLFKVKWFLKFQACLHIILYYARMA